MNTEKLKPLTDDAIRACEKCAEIADDFAGDCWIGDPDWEAATRIAELIREFIRARGKV